MATEQELAAMRDRVATLEAAETNRQTAAAVARELGKYELASPAAADQLGALIAPSISMTRVSGGRELLHDKDYRPLETVVAETLQRPEFGHFLRANVTAASQPGAPAQRPAVPATAPPVAPNEPFQLEGENLGAAIVRQATAQRAVLGDPRLDPSQPLAIGLRAFTRP